MQSDEIAGFAIYIIIVAIGYFGFLFLIGML